MAKISTKIQKREELSKKLKEIVRFVPSSKIREGEEYGILNIKESKDPDKEGSVNLITIAKGNSVVSTSISSSNVKGEGSFIVDVEFFSKALSNIYDSELELTVEQGKLYLIGKRNNVKIPVYEKEDSSLKAPIKRYVNLEDNLKEEVMSSHVIMVDKSSFCEKLGAAQIYSFGGKIKDKYNVISVDEKEVSILGKGTCIAGKGVVDIKKTLKKEEVKSGIMITDEVGDLLMSILPKAAGDNLRIYIGDKKLIFQVGANTIVAPKKSYEGKLSAQDNLFKVNTESSYMLTCTDIKGLCSMVTFLEESVKKTSFNKEIYKIKITVDPTNKKVISKGGNWVECRKLGKDSNNISMELSLTAIESAMNAFYKFNKSKDCALNMSVMSTPTGKYVHFKMMIKPEKEEDQKIIKKWIQDDLIIVLAGKEVSESDIIAVEENDEVVE